MFLFLRMLLGCSWVTWKMGDPLDLVFAHQEGAKLLDLSDSSPLQLRLLLYSSYCHLSFVVRLGQWALYLIDSRQLLFSWYFPLLSSCLLPASHLGSA